MAGEPIEKQLYCSVIQLAIDDYFAPMPSWKQGINDWHKNHREARLFLLKTGGVWARSRADICSAAGIDPVALREAVLREEARLRAQA
jgi:hypothetical protein